MANGAAKRFQFSLGEMMGVALFVGAVLTYVHTRPGARVEFTSDVLILVTIILPVLLGLLWASRKGESGWRRRTRAGVLVTGALFLTALSNGWATFNCWECGACLHESFGIMTTVEDWEVSQRVQKLMNKPCPHRHWHLQTRINLISIADGFPSHRVPVLIDCESPVNSVLTYLEKIPNREWTTQILDSMGDRENLLKYPAMMVVLDLSANPPADESQWRQWWETNQVVFQSVRSSTIALPLAQAAVDRELLRFGRYIPGAERIAYLLKADLPGIKLPP